MKQLMKKNYIEDYKGMIGNYIKIMNESETRDKLKIQNNDFFSK